MTADNLRVIESLDLSGFNVIDVDSYGAPANQLIKIFENDTLRAGTVIIYTCITNKMSSLNKEVIKLFRLGKMYKKVKTLFNAKSAELYHALLYEKGITEVYRYTQKSGSSYYKEYGYFVVNK